MPDEYIKDFDTWNNKKKSIDENFSGNFFFSEREIWWASLGVNIGREIDGKDADYVRPVLIIRKFSADTLWVIPMTSTSKIGSHFYTIILGSETKTLSLLQMRMISDKRLLRQIYKIREDEFDKILDKVILLLRKNETPLTSSLIERGISGA